MDGSARTKAPKAASSLLLPAVLVVAVVLSLGSAVRGPAEYDISAPRTADIRRPSVLPRAERLVAAQRKQVPTDERCLSALVAVESTGLHLRDDTEFRCPGIAAEPGDERHWGATCWQNELCPGGSWIAVDPELIGPDDARLRYVVAHEICHVISYTRTGDRGTEPAADACAAGAGFPRV